MKPKIMVYGTTTGNTLIIAKQIESVFKEQKWTLSLQK